MNDDEALEAVRALFAQQITLAGWLARWIEGTLHQPNGLAPSR